MMYFDGSLMLNNVGFGIVLISPKWEHLEYVPQLQFDGATNNIAKYEALLHDLCIAKSLVIHRHYIDKDFELIVKWWWNERVKSWRWKHLQSTKVWTQVQWHRATPCASMGQRCSRRLSWVHNNHSKHHVVHWWSVCGSLVARTLKTVSDTNDLPYFGHLSPTSSNIVFFVLGMPNRGYLQWWK
jgi:ribonuclease HI